MSSARILARTATWLRRRVKWILLLLTAFVLAYLVVERSSVAEDRWKSWFPSVVAPLAAPSPPASSTHSSSSSSPITLVPNASLSGHKPERPQSFAVPPEVPSPPLCGGNDTQFKADFDLQSLYGTNVGRKGQEEHERAVPPSGNKEKLRVFVLPFTHVDPGWLKTFDQYSEDTNKILNNMHSFMSANPKMRFMWAEFVFFERWWSNQSEEVKKDVRGFVKEGRLELASGSWVMTDEANAYFPVSVDNIVEGHQWIQKEFGQLPKVVWSNDPFGYSNSVPFLFQQAGINRNVINRIHHGLKQFLQGQRAIPFHWKQLFPTQKGDKGMLTQVLPYTHYDILNSCGPSQSACCQFDFKRMTHWSCPGPKPQPITSENAKAKGELLANELKKMADMYEAPVVLMMHGDDFRFDMIEEWHQQHDNFVPLFDEMNKRSDIEISFGTFSDYFDVLEGWYSKEKKDPATITGDFFPYMCAMGDYWTGYYTTRPFYKKQGRQAHHLIRSADLLTAQAVKNKAFSADEAYSKLTKARRILALFQHHDAITGTSKNPVMDNYSRLLHEASGLAREVVEAATNALQGGKGHRVVEYPINYDKNIEKILLKLDSNTKYRVSVFNSMTVARNAVVSLLLSTHEASILLNDKEVAAQVEPAIVNGSISKDSVMISFRASLPPLSTVSFVLLHSSSPSMTKKARVFTSPAQVPKMKDKLPSIFTLEAVEGELKLATTGVSTIHDPVTGLLVSSSLGSCSLKFSEYRGSRGGAYILRSSGVPSALDSSSASFLLVQGSVQSSSHSWMLHLQHSLTLRDLPGSLSSQLHLSARVDLTKEQNTEMVLVLSTAEGEHEFYTDSVGLQLLKRDFYTSLSTAANYYPMPTAAILQNERRRVTVLTDLEHGVMKRGPNAMEIMLDRMLNQDDGKGLGGGADGIPTDLKAVEMHLTVVVEERKEAKEGDHLAFHSAAAHVALQSLLYPPLAMATTETSLPSPPSSVLLPFPCPFQLLTVRQLEPRRFMAIFFHSGIDCGTESCEEGSFSHSLATLLRTLGVEGKVEQTYLNGVSVHSKATMANLGSLASPLPQQFASFVFDL